MDAITIYPENKGQEKTLEAMLELMRLRFEKTSVSKLRTMSERLQELEDIMDAMEAEKHRGEPTVKWKDVKKRLNHRHSVQG